MAQPLRIMTYNVRYFGHGTRGLTSTEGALRRISEAISALDPLPDVVALQEVETYSVRADIGRRKKTGRKPQLRRMLDELNTRLGGTGHSYRGSYFASHRYGLPRGGSLYTTGLGILVHNGLRVEVDDSSPPVDITHRRIKATARWKQTRICAHLRVVDPVHDRTLDVYNTHLSLPQFLTWRSVAYTRRMGYGPNQVTELENVLEFIDRTRSSDAMVLMGDFNSLPGSPVYERVREAGLIDPLADHHELAMDEYRRFPSAGFMNFRMHLDYLFSSPQMQWTDFSDTHPFGASESPFHGLSDHSPIIGRARW